MDCDSGLLTRLWTGVSDSNCDSGSLSDCDTALLAGLLPGVSDSNCDSVSLLDCDTALLAGLLPGVSDLDCDSGLLAGPRRVYQTRTVTQDHCRTVIQRCWRGYCRVYQTWIVIQACLRGFCRVDQTRTVIQGLLGGSGLLSLTSSRSQISRQRYSTKLTPYTEGPLKQRSK